MFLECEDGLLPGWLNTKLGFFDFFFTCHFPVFTLFSFFFLLNSDIDTLTDREQRWVSVSEMAVHRNYVNIFLVPCTLFLGQLFFRYEAELGRLNVKHMYWLACRHSLHFSEPTLNNRFCLCSGSLPEPTLHFQKYGKQSLGGNYFSLQRLLKDTIKVMNKRD